MRIAGADRDEVAWAILERAALRGWTLRSLGPDRIVLARRVPPPEEDLRPYGSGRPVAERRVICELRSGGGVVTLRGRVEEVSDPGTAYEEIAEGSDSQDLALLRTFEEVKGTFKPRG